MKAIDISLMIENDLVNLDSALIYAHTEEVATENKKLKSALKALIKNLHHQNIALNNSLGNAKNKTYVIPQPGDFYGGDVAKNTFGAYLLPIQAAGTYAKAKIGTEFLNKIGQFEPLPEKFVTLNKKTAELYTIALSEAKKAAKVE